ncbi:MAG: helix-turn-helix domain-containing protein [Chitinophagaceae bacterium]|jgi:transcriptional regulator with XRE-family HTH domain|nr:helix-turn-helix domain-containing protein [Chitinophagaceae bacterium]
MPGTRIKQHREAKGITQLQMAESLHITQSTYSRIEQKEENLTIGQLKKIAAVLQVAVIDLLPDELVVQNNR